MRIVNETKNAVIGDNSEFVYSLLSRMKGLMLSKPRDLVLVSPREDIGSSTIHMLFMRFSIDVIWLDSRNRVVDLQRNIKPFSPLKPGTWRIYRPKNPAKYVIELGVEKIDEVDVGDKIKFLHPEASEALHDPL